jgi:Uri superfamily endonuclease
MDDLPVRPGTYALILELAESRSLDVGRLGRFDCPPGIYVYLGSARGPGGLRGRLGRHLRGDGRPHWHIDYLVSVSVVKGVGYIELSSGTAGCCPSECGWSRTLSALPGAAIPIPKFGTSDCRSGCRAHLVHFSVFNYRDELPPVLYPSEYGTDAKKVFFLLPV